MADTYRCTEVETLTNLKGDISRIKQDITEIKGNQVITQELVITMNRLVDQMGLVQEDVKDIKGEFKALKNKPNEREEHYIKAVVTAVILLIIGAVLKGLIL